MRRAISVLLVLALCLALCACGGQKSESKKTGEAAPAEPAAAAASGQVVVHARVPADWSRPGAWAWDGDRDVFEAWPGEAMTLRGDWYEISIPDWASNFIVNANGGSVQTEDLSIRPGSEVWIVVGDDGSAAIFYSEPALAAEEAEHVHDWLPATYDAPKTCSVCGETEGLPKGWVGELTGAWSEEYELIRGYQGGQVFLLDEPVENCFTVTMLVNMEVTSGYAYGNWFLYVRDLDGKWSHVGEFDFSEADNGEDREIVFTFDPAVSFDAVTILADRQGTDFGVSYGFLFYDAQVRVD